MKKIIIEFDGEDAERLIILMENLTRLLDEITLSEESDNED
tara:strand:- start:534 stop:656 length:123 start_codon:yes stop_codon:yes gene_type:complete